jgi:hypothetical protein
MLLCPDIPIHKTHITFLFSFAKVPETRKRPKTWARRIPTSTILPAPPTQRRAQQPSQTTTIDYPNAGLVSGLSPTLTLRGVRTSIPHPSV